MGILLFVPKMTSQIFLMNVEIYISLQKTCKKQKQKKKTPATACYKIKEYLPTKTVQ